ncbi:hypothetical protein KDA11_01455 [Candidatus Saccharibacteria bacterium]|nr:hypothetical protein [Candidatus Saccharibacteria bacterium]
MSSEFIPSPQQQQFIYEAEVIRTTAGLEEMVTYGKDLLKLEEALVKDEYYRQNSSGDYAEYSNSRYQQNFFKNYSLYGLLKTVNPDLLKFIEEADDIIDEQLANDKTI